MQIMVHFSNITFNLILFEISLKIVLWGGACLWWSEDELQESVLCRVCCQAEQETPLPHTRHLG